MFRTFTDTRTPSVCRMTWRRPSVKPAVTPPLLLGTQGSRDHELVMPTTLFSTPNHPSQAGQLAMPLLPEQPQSPGGICSELEERLLEEGSCWLADMCRTMGPTQPQGLTSQQETQWRLWPKPGYPIPIHVHGIYLHRDTGTQESKKCSSIFFLVSQEVPIQQLIWGLEPVGRWGTRLLKAKKAKFYP